MITFGKDQKPYSGIVKNNNLSVYEGIDPTGNPIVSYSQFPIQIGWIPVNFIFRQRVNRVLSI